MTRKPSSPVPGQPSKFIYWVLSAVAAAIVGGLIFSWLAKNDPFG